MNKLTTLCYIEKDNKYLMLHRIKKENDINHDKWIGVGGKFEWGESPEECMLREVREETGYTLTSWQYRGTDLLSCLALDTAGTVAASQLLDLGDSHHVVVALDGVLQSRSSNSELNSILSLVIKSVI